MNDLQRIDFLEPSCFDFCGCVWMLGIWVFVLECLKETFFECEPS